MARFRAIALGTEVALLAVLASLTVLSRIGVLHGYVVLSSSMEPTVPQGSLVVTSPWGAGDVSEGDVVAYGTGGNVVVHRVTAVGPDGSLTTQGDANDVADPAPVAPEAVIGRLWLAVPRLGSAIELLNDHRAAAVAAIALANLVICAAPAKGGARTRGRPVVG